MQFVCLLFVLLFFLLFGQFYNCFVSLICYLDNYFNSNKGSSWSQRSPTGCVFNPASFQLFFQLWSQRTLSSCLVSGFPAIGKLRQMPGRHRFAMQCFSFTFSSIMWSLKFSQRRFEHKAWIKVLWYFTRLLKHDFPQERKASGFLNNKAIPTIDFVWLNPWLWGKGHSQVISFLFYFIFHTSVCI